MSKAIVGSSASSMAVPQESRDEEREDDYWSSLPDELLSLILSHVYYIDYHNFRATCTSWRYATPPLHLTPRYPYYQSPCLLLHRIGGTFDFFNPLYNITYQSNVSKIPHTMVYSFNHGWLLMGSQYGKHVFFLDPFTNARIEIPEIPSDVVFHKICFSSLPTSPDCLIIGFNITFGNLVVGIIKRGEENWTIEDFRSSKSWLHFHMSDCNPILYNGRYYCLDIAGNLGVIEPENIRNSWHIYAQRLPRKLRDTVRQGFIVESNGDILSVFVHGGGDRRVCVYKLDISKMIWERLENLGNRTLYICYTTSFSTTATVTGLGNKIYFPKFHGKDGVFYSLATKGYHTYGDDFRENPRQLKESKEFRWSTWILPEFASSSGHHDFKW